jgi:hypothetical protein
MQGDLAMVFAPYLQQRFEDEVMKHLVRVCFADGGEFTILIPLYSVEGRKKWSVSND